MATKKIKYSEPEGYFSKEIRDKYFGTGAKKSASTKKKAGTKSKKK